MEVLFGLLMVAGVGAALVVPWIALREARSATARLDRAENEIARMNARLARMDREPGGPVQPARGPSARQEDPKLAPSSSGPGESDVQSARDQARRVISERPPAERKTPGQPESTASVPAHTAPATVRKGTRADQPSLEESLGARLPVWIGAIAIALAGAFLVKYSFDQGWVGPGVRVTLGALLGVAALGGGEWLRSRSESIAAGLSAAGIAVLYASTLAAGELYGFIPPLAAFALMALVTATAVALSIRQGPIIAAIGLIGGFATPMLIQAGDTSPIRLFSYLFIVEIGLLVVSDRRRWWAISAATMAAAFGWVLLWLSSGSDPTDGPILLLFLLFSAAAFLVGAARSPVPTDDDSGLAQPWLAWVAAGVGLVLSGVVLDAGGYRLLDWALIGLIGAGSLVAGRLRQEWAGIPWFAAVLGAFLLWSWQSTPPTLASPERMRLMTTAAFGALYAIGAYASLWGARKPWAWAALSGASTVGYLLVAYGVSDRDVSPVPWGVVALGLAAVGIAAAWPVVSRRERIEGGNETLAALAAAVTTLIALAIPMELSREWIGVAWALESVAVVLIAERLGVKQVRWLAWPIAAMVGARLLINPYVIGYPIGERPILNWLLYGYGVPIVAFVTAAMLAARDDDERLAEALKWLSLALGLWLISLQVHHLFSPDDMGRVIQTFGEGSTYAWIWLAYALALWRAARRWPDRVLERGGVIIAVLGLVAFLAGQLLGRNPLLDYDLASGPLWVGERPILNWLILAYAFPAALSAALAFEAQRISSGQKLRALFAGSAMLGSFMLLTLEIRQFFQGAVLEISGSITSFAERSTYSIAWILFSAALLALGINRGWKTARYGALAVMLLSVVKVFLYDIGNLGGLYRVGSFLGLGASLFGIAWLYQRYVVGRSDE